VYDNGVALCGFQMDSISYDETRYLNAHIDYKMKANGGSYVQHISALPGYNNGVYKKFKNDGVVNLMDGKAHLIKIEVKDCAGNTTVVQFNVINKDVANTRCKDSIAMNSSQYFLPNALNAFDNGEVRFTLPTNALYDSIHFKYSKTTSTNANVYSGTHIVHYANVPVHSYFTIQLKATKAVLPAFQNKMIIKRLYTGGKFDVVKAKRTNDWYSADFRGFGNFILLYDNVPPIITPISIKDGANLSKATGFSFTIKDENEELQNFKATIDDKWILCSNDKGVTFKHKFDEQTPPGNHVLKIYVEDAAGNSAEKTINFIK
jgi:hypothetical protein